jgi:hypothetical protein
MFELTMLHYQSLLEEGFDFRKLGATAEKTIRQVIEEVVFEKAYRGIFSMYSKVRGRIARISFHLASTTFSQLPTLSFQLPYLLSSNVS